MSRIAFVLVASMLAGSSEATESNTTKKSVRAEVEDGGVVENADRDRAQKYFNELRKVKSAEEEKKLLTSFGKWLRDSEYKIRVEEKKGKHDLSCPYFPPVTPWTEHKFYDIENLKLLPRLEDEAK